MNVLFLSPYFPPNALRYCAALRRRGARVLAVGDAPAPSDARAADVLAEYVCEPQMGDYAALHAAVRGLIERHGPIHRLDSNGEHWLEAEGRLRDDFGVAGPGHEETVALRSKLHMGRVFGEAGLAYPPTLAITSALASVVPERVRAFRARHGLPLVFKPESGSGSVDTFMVRSDAELEAALSRSFQQHVVQPFVPGDIVTFDGLTDREGRIVFATSHAYDVGIMQLRQGSLDGHYYSLRAIPTELERVGRRAVAAFGLKERFFHLEFFAAAEGYVALELNIRPPGGFTTDMMSAACDFDVYDLWAAVITGDALRGFAYERRYFTAHAGRRHSRRYQLGPEQLERELGPVLFAVEAVPDAFAVTMGNVAYLLRSPELDTLKRAVALVQRLA